MTSQSLVARARSGCGEALEQIVIEIQGDIYRLSLRMLWHPEDAEDATQEILIRVIKNLGTFRFESEFSTWVYRIASNLLLTTRKRRMEQRSISFEQFSDDLVDGLSDAALTEYSEAEQLLLVEEVKVGCTQAMLLCLDRDHRMAYILGEIMELGGDEAACILGIKPDAFRKRLSRSRERIRTFLQGNCGLVNPDSPCRCHRRVRRAVQVGRVNPRRLLFAGHATIASAERLREEAERLDGLRHSIAIHRSNPEYAAPQTILNFARSLLDSMIVGSLDLDRIDDGDRDRS